MELCELIRQLRIERGYSQDELARLVGYKDRSSIAKVESGKVDLSQSKVSAFAMALGVTPAYLLGLSPDPPAPLPSNLIRLPASRQTVPLVGQIACGTPILAEENIESYVELPEHVRADYALTCKGDSMINAGIRDGDVVYIRQQEEVENGQITAVMVDSGEATLKRFYRDGSTVTLIAENPAVPPMVFSGEDINRLRVIGLSVAYIHLLEK